MTTVIQEDTVRQLHLKQKVMELHVTKDTYVTSQAKDYIREKGMRLIVDEPESDPAAIRFQGFIFCFCDIECTAGKPEHVTFFCYSYRHVLPPFSDC